MRHSCLFIALAWCFPFVAFAQRADSMATAPRLMLKASVGDLIGTQYSRVHLSAAWRMTPRQYVEVGGGRLIPFGIAAQKVAWNDFSGYTFEASYRLFSKPLGANMRPLWWLAGGITYQELEGNISGDFSRQDQNYSQRLKYDVKDQRTGGKISGGIMFFLGKHVTLDWGISFFIFDRKWTFSELPEDVLFLRNGSSHWSYGNQRNRRTEARGAMILKVGWAFY
ncbi:MAG: hypothetical protein ACKV1O_15495 [Saprospiraceae bacterium]